MLTCVVQFPLDRWAMFTMQRRGTKIRHVRIYVQVDYEWRSKQHVDDLHEILLRAICQWFSVDVHKDILECLSSPCGIPNTIGYAQDPKVWWEGYSAIFGYEGHQLRQLTAAGWKLNRPSFDSNTIRLIYSAKITQEQVMKEESPQKKSNNVLGSTKCCLQPNTVLSQTIFVFLWTLLIWQIFHLVYKRLPIRRAILYNPSMEQWIGETLKEETSVRLCSNIVTTWVSGTLVVDVRDRSI